MIKTSQTRVSDLAETQRTSNERHALAASKRQQLTQEIGKTDQRSRLTQLVAPVDGTVQQVAIHTEGGVVTPAQVLMSARRNGGEADTRKLCSRKSLCGTRASTLTTSA